MQYLDGDSSFQYFIEKILLIMNRLDLYASVFDKRQVPQNCTYAKSE